MAGTGMSGGANRKPTVMKVLEGTLRSDRTPPNEPMPEKISIPPPAPETLDEHGRKHWNAAVPEMVKIGLLTTIDIDQFAAYCNEMGAYWHAEAQRKICLSELWIKDALSWLGTAQKHLKAGRDLAIQFGLTPGSRSRINVPQPEKKNDLDEL